MDQGVPATQLRSFGLIVGAIFALIGVSPIVFHGQGARMWAIVVAVFLAAPAMLYPRGLLPVFRVWMAIGHALGWINTRILLTIVFFGIFTPGALFMRLFRKDPLQRRYDPYAGSYRIPRTFRHAEHMRRQF